MRICPCCQRRDWRDVLKTPQLDVIECRGCGLHVGQHSAGSSFGQYDEIWQAAGEQYVELLGSLRRRQSARWEALMTSAFGRGGRVLDFGTGRGWFARALKTRGWDVMGADASNEALKHLEREGISAIEILDFRRLPVLVPEVRLLTALDVLEHFKAEDLPELLQTVRKIQGLEGVLFKVPATRGFFFRLAKMFARQGRVGPWHQLWQVGTFPPHEVYFDEKSLRLLLEREGFEILVAEFDPDFEPTRLLARIASLPKALQWLDAPISFLIWLFVKLTGMQDSLTVLARPGR